MFNKPLRMNQNNQQGIALLLTIVVISLGLTVVLGLANIFLNELIIARSANEATMAFYAADAGIEHALLVERQGAGLAPCGASPCYASPPLTNGATFEYYVTDNAGTRLVKAVGSFGQTNRALEISYPAP